MHVWNSLNMWTRNKKREEGWKVATNQLKVTPANVASLNMCFSFSVALKEEEKSS